MSITQVTDKQIIAPLFAGLETPLLLSCLHDCMGRAYADDPLRPTSGQILVRDFCYFAGDVNLELVRNLPVDPHADMVILAPPSAAWAKAIEEVYGDRAIPRVRYATKRDGDAFDGEKLREMVTALAPPYIIRRIDQGLYEEILSLSWARDWCAGYERYESFERHGLGAVILKGREIVSGASSYAYYHGGIEIQIDTLERERRKGLAQACGAWLILACLERGWYPDWDAHTPVSMALARTLGYRLDREYGVYEIALAPA